MKIITSFKPVALLLLALVFCSIAKAADPAFISTFQSIGIHWDTAPGTETDPVCSVRYRESGAATWLDGHDLWWDWREDYYPDKSDLPPPNEVAMATSFRGSLMQLEEDTTYEIELTVTGGATWTGTTTTRSSDWPIAQTITLPADTNGEYVITTGGSAETGYVLYEPAGASATITGGTSNIRIQASYVVVRGLTLKGANISAIEIEDNLTDIVIEGCDISGWASNNFKGTAIDYNDDGHASARFGGRFTVQGCYIHHPAQGVGSSRGNGPVGIKFAQSFGENVIRWNTIRSDLDTLMWDGIGGPVNFSYYGPVGNNTDIYENDFVNFADDGIEADGGGWNLRIWGNRIDVAKTGLSVAPVGLGPTYIFRNVGGAMHNSNNSSTSGFIKVKGFESDNRWIGGGRFYVYHNTAFLRPKVQLPDGCRTALGWGADLLNCVSRNNVFEANVADDLVIKDDERNKRADKDYSHEANDIDYDLYYGTLNVTDPPNLLGPHMTGSIRPVYDLNNDRLSAWQSGHFHIASGTPGHNDGTPLPGFNLGAAEEGGAPDRGALERGAENMAFGTILYTLSPAPAAPSNLTAVAQTSNRIYLAWEDATFGEPIYTVERSTDGSAYETIASGLTDPHFTDRDRVVGTLYDYRVRKVSGGGQSAPSNVSSITPASTASLEPIADLYVRAGSYAEANIGLDHELRVSDIVNPEFDREIYLRFDVSNLGSGQPAILQLTPLELGTDAAAMTIDFAVVSDDSWSETDLVWNDKPTSAAVPFASLSGDLQIGVPIEIDISTQAQAEAAGDGILSLRISSTSEGAGRAITFASSEIDSSTFNFPLLVSAAPAAPTNVTAVSTSASRISLFWDASPTATSYHIDRSTSGGTFERIATSITSLSYFDSDLTMSTAYSYVVTAVNAVGESTVSTAANLTTLVSFEAGPEADANVQSGIYENDNFGSATDLWVKDEPDPDKSRVTFLRFDVSSMIDAEGVVLQLMPLNVGLGTPTTLTFDFVADDTWDESTITWDNQPESSAPPLKTITDGFTEGVPLEVDITASVLAEASGDGVISIAIHSTTTASNRFVTFGSKENANDANRPLLIATIDSPIPARVTGLTATAVSTSQIDLSWDPADRADSYTVKRLPPGGGAYVDLASGITSTSYSDTGLDEYESYTYVVTATNMAGTSSNSASTTGTTLPSSTPAAPGGFAATALGNSGKIDLSWNANAITESYTLKRSTSSGGPYTTLTSGIATTSYSDTGLTDGVPYYYVLTAENPLGSSPNSSEVSATPFLAPPAQVSGLNAATGIAEATLSWLAVPETDTYTIKRSTSSGGPYTTVATGITDTEYTDTGLTNETVYYYVVAGVNASGEGPDSAEASVTPHAFLVLFFDSFESPPETIGTNPTQWNVSHVGIVVNDATASEGTNSLFVRDGSNREVTFGTTIDLTDAAAIEISFDFAQLSSIEAGEGLVAFDVDFGEGFETVMSDEGNADGLIDGNYAGTTLILDDTDGTGPVDFTSYSVTIDGAYFDGLLESNSLKLRFVTHSSAGSEAFRLDNIRVAAVTSSATPSLDPPANLTASATSAEQIDLSWDASIGAESYRIKRANVSSGPYTTIATDVSENHYTDSGLTAETAYYYVVSAAGGAGESLDSSEASATTLLDSTLFFESFEAPPETVGNNPTLWTVSHSGIVVNAAAASAGSNSLFVRDGNNRSVVLDTPIDISSADAVAISFDFAQLSSTEAGEGLIAFAVDFGSGFETVISDKGYADGLTEAVYSGVPLSLDDTSGTTPASFTNYSVVIDRAYFFGVWGGDSVKLKFVTQSSASAESFRIDNIRVSSTDSTGASEIDAPTGLAATAASAIQVDLSWNPSLGAETYNVKRSTASGGPYSTIATDVYGNEYTDTSVAGETTYYYVVSAVAAMDESPDSAEASATTLSESTLFFDSFETPTETTGNNPTRWSVSNAEIVVNAAAASEGTHSLFVRDGNNRIITLDTPIDLTGTDAIEISFDFAQLSSTEAGEGLVAFMVDFGSGFEAVIEDKGSADGLADGSYAGMPITLANINGTGPVSFIHYKVTIDSTYYSGVLDGDGLRLRFRTTSGASAEDFRIDNVLVEALPAMEEARVALPEITSPATATGSYGSSFNYFTAARNEPTGFAANGLPSGLSIDPESGEISGTPTECGSFAVTLEASNAFGSGTAELSLEIAQIPQSITFTSPGSKTYGDPAFALMAIASSALPVSFEVVSGPANVSGDQVTISGVGNVVIRAHQSGNSNVRPAVPVEVSFSVAKASASVSFDEQSLLQPYNGSPREVVASTSPAGLAVNLTYNGSELAPIYPGLYEVVATVDDSNHEGSAAGNLIVTVSALVQKSAAINDNSGIDGSLQLRGGDPIYLNDRAAISHDLLLPGQPTVQLSDQSFYIDLIDAGGASQPSEYTVHLNGSSLVRYLVSRVDPMEMRTTEKPAQPTGTRNLMVYHPGQDLGDVTAVRNLTLIGSIGDIALPPGAYGKVNVIGAATLVLGTPGASTPDVYEMQKLQALLGGSIEIAGPILLRIDGHLTLQGNARIGSDPDQLSLEIFNGHLIMTGDATINGHVVAPNSLVILNNSSRINGTLAAERLILNNESLIHDPDL